MRIAFFALVLALFPTLAHSLIPPMDLAELEAEADVVVDVTVSAVTPHGEPYEDHCYGWQGYRATLKVEKAYKGKPGESIKVGYSSVISNVKNCVGGKTPYSMGVGQRYKLYLSGNGQPNEVVYGFINWAGVIALPKAPPKKKDLKAK